MCDVYARNVNFINVNDVAMRFTSENDSWERYLLDPISGASHTWGIIFQYNKNIHFALSHDDANNFSPSDDLTLSVE